MEGDPAARAALNESARYLGLGIFNAVWALDADAIVIDGTMTEAWPLVSAAIREQFPEGPQFLNFRNLVLRPSALGGEASLIGAITRAVRPALRVRGKPHLKAETQACRVSQNRDQALPKEFRLRAASTKPARHCSGGSGCSREQALRDGAAPDKLASWFSRYHGEHEPPVLITLAGRTLQARVELRFHPSLTGVPADSAASSQGLHGHATDDAGSLSHLNRGHGLLTVAQAFQKMRDVRATGRFERIGFAPLHARLHIHAVGLRIEGVGFAP